MKHVYTDGGRTTAGFYHEKKDCTVRAAAVCLGIPYQIVHSTLAALGRKPKKGFVFHKAIKKLQLKIVPGSEDFPYKTLKHWENKLHRGRFVVKSAGHVFAAIDGEIYDLAPSGARTRVKAIYEFEPNPRPPVKPMEPRQSATPTNYFIQP